MKSNQHFAIFFVLLLWAFSAESQGFLRIYDFNGQSGEIKAIRHTPDGGFAFVAALATDSMNTVHSAWLVKTNASGDTLWTRSLYAGAQAANYLDLEVGPAGELYAMSAVENNFPVQGKIARFTADGQQEWANTGIIARNIEIANGGIWTFTYQSQGVQARKLDFLGNIIDTYTYSNIDFINYWDAVGMDDGGVCMIVSCDGPGTNFNDMFLVRVDGNGNQQWVKSYNIFGYEFNGRVIRDADGGFVFTDFRSYNVEMTKTDASGNEIWRQNHADLDDYDAYGLVETADNGYLVFGNTSGLSAGDGKIFLLKTNATGEVQWVNTFPQNNAGMTGRDMIPLSDGGVLICGAVNLAGAWQPCLIKADAFGNVFPNYISGHVRFDQNHNCTAGAQEPALKNWIVEATEAGGLTFYATTNADGYYGINVDSGFYTVRVVPPGAIWEPCDNGQYDADLGAAPDTALVDFMVKDSVLCSLLEVSLSTSGLRRCFDNTFYVNWCNRGTSAAFNALVEVRLPPELDFVSASQPVVQSGDTLFFALGTVGFGDCGQLTFTATVNCDSTELGQTLCVEAHILPDTVCYETLNWSGARIVADAECLGDTAVSFRLKNIGAAPSAPLGYIITEDLVVLMQGNYSLDPGETLVIFRPANGSTQRIEGEQEPGYPFPSKPSAAVEGCGILPASFGFINQYALDDGSPFTDIECREVVGSFDPNDKQGFPAGYGPQRYIEPGTDLTYLIRFQNTGTDTAFTVVVRDTLSAWIDPATVRPGAASHPFIWELSGSGVLAFRFDNILLPDSNVNEAASHGFVQFAVSQRADVPIGAVIENRAAIYFDFNEPVITNSVTHLVGVNFYTSSVDDIEGPGLLPVRVAPNPFREKAVIELPEEAPDDAVFRLFDHTGKIVREAFFSGKTLNFSARNLPPGLYWFGIHDDGGRLIGSGKMIRH